MPVGENKALEGAERDPFATHETQRSTLVEIVAAPGGGNTPDDRLPRRAVRRAGVEEATNRANGSRPEEAFTGVEIRPAVEADAARIKAMVRAERVNPRNLH